MSDTVNVAEQETKNTSEMVEDSFALDAQPSGVRMSLPPTDADHFIVDEGLMAVLKSLMSLVPATASDVLQRVAKFEVTRTTSKIYVANADGVAYFEFNLEQCVFSTERHVFIIELDKFYKILQAIGSVQHRVAIYEDHIQVDYLGGELSLDKITTSDFIERFAVPAPAELELIEGPIPIKEFGAAISFIGRYASSIANIDEVAIKDKQMYVTDGSRMFVHNINIVKTMAMAPKNLSVMLNFIADPYTNKPLPNSSESIFLYRVLNDRRFVVTFSTVDTGLKAFLMVPFSEESPRRNNILKIDPKYSSPPLIDLSLDLSLFKKSLGLLSIVLDESPTLTITIPESLDSVLVNATTARGMNSHENIKCNVLHKDPSFSPGDFSLCINFNSVLDSLKYFSSSKFHMKVFPHEVHYIVLFHTDDQFILNMSVTDFYQAKGSKPKAKKDEAAPKTDQVTDQAPPEEELPPE